jgi:GTPase SAR1 family protein
VTASIVSISGIVGDGSVGKMPILLRFTDDKWDADCQPTLGIEFVTKKV